jgi:hypothetical protein
MLYLVKHTDGTYKLHTEDGTVKDTYDWRFDLLSLDEDAPEREAVPETVKQSVLSDMTDPERTAYQTLVETTSSPIAWRFRDLTLEDETVPWETTA